MSDPREELQRDVERTRRELGETVEALAHKVDVPGRVKEQAHETRVKMINATTDTVAKMTDATNDAVAALPPPVADQVEKARRHPAMVAAVLIGLVLLVWKLSRRNG